MHHDIMVGSFLIHFLKDDAPVSIIGKVIEVLAVGSCERQVFLHHENKCSESVFDQCQTADNSNMLHMGEKSV